MEADVVFRVMRRFIATLCVLSALVGLGGLVPSPTMITRTAAQSSATITPGAVMITMVGERATSACTASFVFRGAEATYLAYAAHCAIPVQAQHRTGCEYETLPMGARVEIRGIDGGLAHGSLAYSSWATMREIGETDEARCRFNDFALVEIDATDLDVLDPTVPVVGGPTRLRRSAPEANERVLSFQPQNTAPAMKDGISTGVRGNGWSHRVDVSPAAQLGDSGSGLLDEDGAAFGVLATRYLDRLATSGVTDLPRALAYAARFGDLGRIELVPGREPFQAPRRLPEPSAADDVTPTAVRTAGG